MRHYFDPATGVEDFYSLKQIKIIIKPHFYPLLCQFLMKIIIVINLVYMYIKTPAEDDDFQRLLKRRERERERERERPTHTHSHPLSLKLHKLLYW